MTQKQKNAASRLVENGGNVSRAMLDVGYSPATANTPQKLTESKGWKELMEHYFPDNDLLKVGQEGLTATKPIGALVLIKNGKDGKTETILKDNEGVIEVPDHAVRHKYFETALKLKGRLKEGLGTVVGGDLNVTIVRDAS